METEVLQKAREVLEQNDRTGFTVPASELYPHQWLWDSCFIAIGLRHLNPERAQQEIESLIRGQWANGMLPHIIFSDSPEHRREHNLWRSWLNPHSPDGVITSGLTQPPMLAEAVFRVGQKLKSVEKRSWYKKMLPHLIAYHQWLYAERGGGDGLICIIHPYESGLDNSPPLVEEMQAYAWPWWLSLLETTRLDNLVSLVRRDTRRLPSGQRITNAEAIAHWALQRRLRSQAYDSQRILKRPKWAVQDLAFNCILARANTHLAEIAKIAGQSLPKDLAETIRNADQSLEKLWDEAAGMYFSRSGLSGQLIDQPTVTTLLPLYSGTITPKRAAQLVGLMKKRSLFHTNWPLPSVPTNSPYFNELNYWQGPAWININWLVIDGLNRYGFSDEADELKNKTLRLTAKSGCFEYFSPLDGQPAGAENFSWTAALDIDLLKS